MAKGYVPIFFDWLETTQDLEADEKGNLIDAVVSYAAGLEYEHLLNGASRIAFRFLKGQVDRNAAIAVVRKQSREGKTNSNKQEQNVTNENKTKEGATNEINNKNNKNKNKNNNQNNNELFDRFWQAYPRKVNKPGAVRAFDKLCVDETMLGTMLTAIGKQKESAQWLENGGQFIPHPATWLNGHRWEDEVAPAKPGKANPVADYEQRDYSGVQDELMNALAEEMEMFKQTNGAS